MPEGKGHSQQDGKSSGVVGFTLEGDTQHVHWMGNSIGTHTVGKLPWSVSWV